MAHCYYGPFTNFVTCVAVRFELSYPDHLVVIMFRQYQCLLRPHPAQNQVKIHYRGMVAGTHDSHWSLCEGGGWTSHFFALALPDA